MISLEQNKIQSGERLAGRHRQNLRPDQEEFEQFKDEQFTNHRKSQLHCKRIRQKTINSLSVYTLTTPPIPDIPLHSIDAPSQQSSVPQPHTLPSAEEAVSMGEQKKPREHRIKTSKEFTILRYSRNEPHQRSPFDLTQQQRDLLKSSEKINIIKKILDLYNSKSIQRSYYSNLINNLTNSKPVVDSSSPNPKGKNMLLKKQAPKVSFRKNFKKGSATANDSAIKVGQMNMHGFDLAEEYYNHSSITLEAQSMNELIKDFLQKKKMNRSAEHALVGKKRSQTRANHELQLGQMGKIRKNLTKYETLNEIKIKMLENMSDNSLNHKINKFRQFLFMINFANGIYRELDVPKYEQPFKIFVGKGNNSNLIKSIMKKRFWFEFTKNRDEAHFVWTQLKEENVYERQAQLAQHYVKNKPSQLELAKGICEDANDVDTAREQTADSSANLEKTIEPSKTRQETKITTNCRSKKIDINCSQTRLLTHSQSIEYNKILAEFVIRKKYKFSDRLRYMKDINAISIESTKSLLIHNHLPLNGLLGNKKALLYMLRQYYRLTQRNVFETVPLTFHIKKGLLDEEFKVFMQKFQLCSKEGKNYWIIKPGEFSNRGQGITCTDKLEDIRTRITNLKKLGKNKSLILQKYITNPLLYNGRKFDIRTYMLITVNNGNLRGYWYQQGYIRTSSSIWTLDNITDTFIHLTNDAIQKYSNNYGKYQPGNKLTYSELQRYLDSLKNVKPINFQNQICPQLKSIAIDAIKATSIFINPTQKGNNFEIFGFDFMIDSNFKPWLIEINTNPCLEMSCPVLERIIPSMVQNAFRIAVDPIFVPPANFSSTFKYNIPENALHYNKFEVIFDQEKDGTGLKELYANNRIVDSIDEYEEDKETYEEQGEEIALLEP